MARYLGYVTLSGTPGLKTFNLTGITTAPTWATLTVCEKSTTDTAAHTSEGKILVTPNYTRQRCQSTYADTSGADSFNSSTHCVQHYERVSGSITKVLSASFDSFTSTGIKLNVDIPNADYQLLIEAGD